MRAGFVTCVQLGLGCIEEIYAAGGTLDFVMTLADDRARAKSGRVYLDDVCAARGVELLKVTSINEDHAVSALRERDVDWLFIIGWSQIARRPVLETARRGVLGMHPTLLPEGRGRAAVPWAILRGLRETGVTLFKLDDGVDTGPILAQHRIPIAPDETATTLYTRVADAHRTLMREAWPRLVDGTVVARPQDDARATIWPGRHPEDGRLDAAMTVAEAERLVRATTRPYPGAFLPRTHHVVRVWKGAVATTTSAPANALRLFFRNGAYDATDYDVEPTPSAQHPCAG